MTTPKVGFRDALRAVFKKDLLLWRRDRKLIAAGIIPPLAIFTAFYFLLMPILPGLKMALIVEDQGPYAQEMAQIIETLQSPQGRYWRVVTRDPTEAQRLFAELQVMAIITIPDGFSHAVAEGRQPELGLATANVSSDISKNVRLYTSNAILEFMQRHAQAKAQVRIEDVNRSPHRVHWIAYIAMGIFVFSLMLGSMINAGAAVSREWEQYTVKELLLSQAGRLPIILGKMLIGLVAGLIAGAIMLVTVWLLARVGIVGNPWMVLLIAVLTCMVFVGLGMVVGIFLQSWFRLGISSIVFVVFLWLLGGAFGSLSVMPDSTQTVSRFLPTTYTLDALHKLMLWGSTDGLWTDVAVLAVVALACIVLGTAALSRVRVEW